MRGRIFVFGMMMILFGRETVCAEELIKSEERVKIKSLSTEAKLEEAYINRTISISTEILEKAAKEREERLKEIGYIPPKPIPVPTPPEVEAATQKLVEELKAKLPAYVKGHITEEMLQKMKLYEEEVRKDFEGERKGQEETNNKDVFVVEENQFPISEE